MRIKIPSNTSIFFKHYRLPLVSSAGWLVVVLVLLLLRTYEQRILAGVLGSATGTDYAATLLSKDEDAALTKADTPAVEDKKDQPSSSPPTSISIDTNGSSTTGGVAPTGNGSTVPPTSGGTNTPPPPPPPPPIPGIFRAAITRFSLTHTEGPLVCALEGPLLNTECKRYTLTANVSTYDGPGSVNYTVRHESTSRQSSSNNSQSGNFQAPSGDAGTSVVRTYLIPCDHDGVHVFRFLITSPNTVQSPDVQVEHEC